jgi:hypothetical protein
MLPDRKTLVLCLIGAGLSPLGAGLSPVRAEVAGPPAQATLPLERVLEWVRDSERARQAPQAPAPVAGAVTQLVLEGRLLTDAVDLRAHVELSVLAEDAWVRIPILELSPVIHLSELPTVAGGELLADGGALVFVTRQAGRYAFDLGLLLSAGREGQTHLAELAHHGAALTRLDLRWDEALFRVLGEGLRRSAEGASLFSRANRFRIRWEPRAPLLARSEVEEPARRPPVESVIPLAHASSVVTLEGRRITRIHHQLRFEGEKPIAFRLPEGARVEKVYLNGAAVPFQLEQGQLALTVSPPRVGDQSGTLELVLVDQPGAFHLSGRLALGLPAASWQVDELHVRLHLPVVFDYAWAGGSLAVAEGGGEPGVTWAHRLPTPGKALDFQQSLISSAPDVVVRYEVALEGQIFRGSPAWPEGAQARRVEALQTGRWSAGD